jgi:hypothetical protein
MTREQFYWLVQFFPYFCLLVAVFATRALTRSSRPRLLRLAALLLGSAASSSSPPPPPPRSQSDGSNPSPTQQPVFLRHAHPYAKIKNDDDNDDDDDDDVTRATGAELTNCHDERERHVRVRLSLLVYSGATILFTRGAVLAAHDLSRGRGPIFLPVLILLASLAGLVVFTGGVFWRYTRLFLAGAATKCQTPTFTAHFGALVYPYRENKYWWKAVDLAKTASLACCIAFSEWNRLQLATEKQGQDSTADDNELEPLCSEQAGDEGGAHGSISSPRQLGPSAQLSGLGLYVTSLCLLISFTVVAARSRPYKHAACNTFASAWDWTVVVICANFLWDKIASLVLTQKLSFLVSESCLVSSLAGQEQTQNITQLVAAGLVRRGSTSSRYLRRIEDINENTGLLLALVVLALGTAGAYLTFKAEQGFYASYPPTDQPQQNTQFFTANALEEPAPPTPSARITSPPRHLPQDLLWQFERTNSSAAADSPDDL